MDEVSGPSLQLIVADVI